MYSLVILFLVAGVRLAVAGAHPEGRGRVRLLHLSIFRIASLVASPKILVLTPIVANRYAELCRAPGPNATAAAAAVPQAADCWMLNTRGVSSFNDLNTNNTRSLVRNTCI